jgi:hypothetical protein
LARRVLEGGRLPRSGGVRPQVTVTVDLTSLLGHGLLGADGAWLGPLPTETARRLACDATLTRALITHPSHRDAAGDRDADSGDLPARLRAAVALLPAALGGAPPARLDLGRATRVVAPAQHRALAVRDGGWRLRRHPHGQLTAIPPPRQRPAAA